MAGGFDVENYPLDSTAHDVKFTGVGLENLVNLDVYDKFPELMTL